MAQRLNKKILCFLDEHGTAGVGDLYLGAVLVFARQAGAVDKRFSDLLPASFGFSVRLRRNTHRSRRSGPANSTTGFCRACSRG